MILGTGRGGNGGRGAAGVALAVLLALGAAAGESRGSMTEHRGADFGRGERRGTALEKDALVLDGAAAVGTYDAPVLEREPFDRALVSVNADLERDARVRVLARVRLEGGAWTEWTSFGTVALGGEAVPASEVGPGSGPVRMAIDTLEVHGVARALAWRLELARGAGRVRVRRVAAVTWRRGVRAGRPRDAHPAWGKTLDVPARSQGVEDESIRHRICSPTSLGMVLAFHGRVFPTATVAKAVHDRREGIYGNWLLNVAWAGALGFDATAARLESIDDLEDEIAAGRPVVISHRWKTGELGGAPIASTDGHLIVVRGFTKTGDVEVNDPAAPPATVKRVYRRADFERTWLGNGDGIAYLVTPPR